MEAFLRSQNFVHDDVSTWYTFRKSIDSLPKEDEEKGERGLHNLTKYLEILGNKLTTDSKPELGSQGWRMCRYAFDEICGFAYGLINDEPSKEILKIFYEFIIHLLNNSLADVQLTLALKCLEMSNMKDYFQELDKASLEPLLAAVFKPVKQEEINASMDYGDVYFKLLNTIFQYLTKSQVKDVNNQLLDYAVYCFLDSIHLNEDVYQKIVKIGQMVLSLLNNPFLYITDNEKIRAYIKKCIDTFQSKSFAPNETVSTYTLQFMKDKIMPDLGKQGKLEEVYNELFDLLMTISKCTYTLEGDKYLFNLFYGAQVYFSDFEIKSSKISAEVFENIVQRFIKVVEEIDIKFLNHNGCASRILYALRSVYANDKQKSRSWVSMLIPLLKRSCESTVAGCCVIFSENNAVKWTEHVDIVNQVFKSFLAFQLPPSVNGDEKEKKELKEYLNILKTAVENFFNGLKKDKLIKSYGKEMMDLSLKFMNTEHEELYKLAESIAEKTELNIKEDKNAMIDAIKRFHEILKNESLPWAFCYQLYRAANHFIDKATKPFKDGKLFKNEDFEVFVSLCLTCLQYDCVHPETGSSQTGHFSIFSNITEPLFQWLQALNKMELVAPLVPELIKCFNVDEHYIINTISLYILRIGQVSSGQKVIAPYLENFIVVYLEKGNEYLLTAITQIYPSNPRLLKKHYQNFIEMLKDTGEPRLIKYLSEFFQQVSQKQAEHFATQDIEMLFKKAQEHENSQILILEILQELSKRCPERVIEHLNILFDKSSWVQNSYYFLNDMMVTLAFYRKEVAAKVLADIFSNIKTNKEKNFLLLALNSVRVIGLKYSDLLKERRNELQEFKTTDLDIITHKKLLLNIIDGKSPEDMIEQLKVHKEELASLVGRADETEEILNEVKVDVSKQKEQLDNVKNEVKEQGQKLTNVEAKVDETVVKVEEIDKKTLSHAPYWARDISKLLNPKSEHDWRLLSSRLGYNNEDIRGWAQQADPCMALLNEWYTSHKTSEATLAALTQLQEMDRLDAAAIVENAMKNAEAVVEDEGFVYPSPPPIFISYQWSHQAEVKLLKQHLEMAGYECWLDIGQMGGGDKLFKKIDTGIRAAKVVICCVTSNYAKSPNCNREVNLSVSLNKPIIPLLLEQCPWPPPGSMGPIFSEYLFIRFFQRTGEEMPDQRYWAKDKFQELLMQLNVVGVSPDETKVQPEYRNWWIPVVQEITIDKSKTKNGGTISELMQSDLDMIASDSPDIFISYQWGKQKNIIKLYKRLTSLGFSCWLDIKQMGGGDSLYDKIDRGIRGCKVVLSCVTQKYSLSANCRREVSLTDALKKPMIPLLLEKMTWPPTGPMSMVMTQLVYINFSKDETIQMTWDGPEFNDILSQIHHHIPNKVTTKTSSKPSTNNIFQSNKTKQNTLKPASPLQKPERKNSQTTKPSLAPLKPQPKSNQIQKLPYTVILPPSTASSLFKQDTTKKSDTSVRAPLTKPLPSSNFPNRTPIVEQNSAPNTTPTTILKPVSSLLKPVTQQAKQIAPSNSQAKSKPATKIQQTYGRPSRLPPIKQNDAKKQL